MTRVLRFDKGAIDAVEMTSQGFLKAPAFFTRTGVFTYKKSDGSISRELRHPEDVFAAESLKTLEGIPVTNDHPEIMLIDSKSAKQYMVGYTGDKVQKLEEKIGGTVTITDKEVIDLIDSGRKQEISCGYTHELEEVNGVYNGEEYDVRQRNIVYNHVALVEKGRAGKEVRLRLDSSDAVMIDNENETTEKGSEPMEKIMIGGKEFEASPELAAAITGLMVDLDGMKAKMEEYKAKDKEMEEGMDVKEKELDAMKGKMDSLKEEVEKLQKAKNDSASIQQLVKERVELEKQATRFLGEEAKLDEMDNMAIKKAVIASRTENVKLDGKSDEYISARYDQIVDLVHANETFGKAIIENRKADSKEEEINAEAARQKRMKADAEAWKLPLTAKKA